MRLIISGSRTATKEDFWAGIQACPFSLEQESIKEIIVGAHWEGVDHWAVKWAKAFGHDLVLFPANWKRHSKKAGPIRNQKMADYTSNYWMSGAALYAIWDGESNGTANMIKIWDQLRLKYAVFNFKTGECIKKHFPQ